MKAPEKNVVMFLQNEKVIMKIMFILASVTTH
jgi:hypothetical protein